MPTLQAAKASAPDQEPMGQNNMRQHNKGYTDLDDRYGKIGISAVAAAVRHQGVQRTLPTYRPLLFDRD